MLLFHLEIDLLFLLIIFLIASYKKKKKNLICFNYFLQNRTKSF